MLAVALALVLALALFAGSPLAASAASSLTGATDAVVAITAGANLIGSGIVIAPNRVLTVSHVIDAGTGVQMRVLAGDALLPFTVIAIDRQRDLALLAVELPAGTDPIVWGSSAALTRGEDVIALGFPIGFSSVSLTKGVVSSPEQLYGAAIYVQTDAAINPGSSGGALVDAGGRLVGVNVAKIAELAVDAVGFSIPADDARAFVLTAEPGIALSLELEPAAGSRSTVVAWALGVGLIGVLLAIVRRRAAARNAENASKQDGLEERVQDAQDGHDGRGGQDAQGGQNAQSGQDGRDGQDGLSAVARWRFAVHGPGASSEELIRLPGVLGSAPNADLHVGDPAVAAYHARFVPIGESVEVIDLTDANGMFCADLCVKRAIVGRGESVRIGATTVVFIGRELVKRP